MIEKIQKCLDAKENQLIVGSVVKGLPGKIEHTAYKPHIDYEVVDMISYNGNNKIKCISIIDKIQSDWYVNSDLFIKQHKDIRKSIPWL